jgi:uncharacterized protein YecE (DUF72 family)
MNLPRIGTSGYNYTGWLGSFYPEDTAENRMLAFYAQHFDTVEVNYTFHRMPTVRTLQSWGKETPEDFLFSLKAPRRITHDLRLRDAADPLAFFTDTASALKGRLGVLLFQLPPFLKKDASRLEDFLHQVPEEFRTAFEFRNNTWFSDEVYECMRRFNAALCVTEADQRDTPLEVTADFGYFRLRKPDYTDADLEEWAKRLDAVASQWKDCLVYFRQEPEEVGPQFALRFRDILRGGGAAAPAEAAGK